MSSLVAVRTSIEQRLGRLRRIGLRQLVSLERDTLLRLAKSTLAAVLAWEVMAQLGSPRPVLAALGAILVVQVTVRASLARSIQLMVGVSVGLGAAVVLGEVLGLHWWSIGLVVLLSLVLGEVLRLGPFSSQVAISALLALSLGSGYGLTRALDTAIGAVIGVIVNAVIVPPSLVHEGARLMRGIAENLGSLLADIGQGLIVGPPDEASVERWLARARDIAGDLRRSVALVDQGEESLRYNPRPGAAHDDLARLREARLALEHSTVQTRGIARSLMDLDAARLVRDDPSARQPVSAGLRALGELLVHAAGSVSAFGRLQESPGSVPDREHAESEHAAAAAVRQSASDRLRLVSILDDDRDRLLSSLLVDAVRLVEEVDPTGPHSAAVDPPTVA
ncbi:MAG: hypothetical protein JWN61_687 [Pseudonocardiales bacterium]|nr:hypothetical protein [Pseudonocardiales bacterium]